MLLSKLTSPEAQYDVHAWPGDHRTMPTAHQYIIDNWDNLESGALIDVEHILGLREAPKQSEQETVPL